MPRRSNQGHPGQASRQDALLARVAPARARTVSRERWRAGRAGGRGCRSRPRPRL